MKKMRAEDVRRDPRDPRQTDDPPVSVRLRFGLGHRGGDDRGQWGQLIK